MINDPISDMLTRIRNGYLVRKAKVLVPFSKMKWSIVKILKDEGYINGFQKVEVAPDAAGTGTNQIEISLKYHSHGEIFTSLKRISKPGRRIYVKKDELPPVMSGLGISIISTSQGLMTNRAARRLGLGGEVICEIS